MMRTLPLYLSQLTTEEVGSIVDGEATAVVLLPVGVNEPHGPHLPLGTDITIALEMCRRGAISLRERGVAAVVGPQLAYGVALRAEGLVGAVSLPSDLVQRLVAELCRAYLRDGWHHVSVVNHHLDLGHVAALHAAVLEVNESGGGAEEGGTVPVSFPNVLSRRWSRKLPEEVQSGFCHAGKYDSSLLLAIDPGSVREEIMSSLEPFSVGPERSGQEHRALQDLTGERGYMGDPASSSASEGLDVLESLETMVVTEVLEALGGT